MSEYDKVLALRDLALTAREMLKFGVHEGACDNGPEFTGACTLHLAAWQKREDALKLALTIAGDVLGQHEPEAHDIMQAQPEDIPFRESE